MNYGNIPRPLHPLNVNTSTYSSLHNAVTPQMSTFVPVNHRNPDSRMSMSPRPVELPDITIHFGSGRGTPGVSFSDIKKGKLNWMSDQLVPELQNLGQVSINLNISWPGYGHLPGTYPLELFVNNRPVTRLHLAQQIVKAYERFLANARHATYGGARDENGTTWEIGPNYTRMHFVLRSLSNAHKRDGVFQADIQIVMG